MPPNDAAIAAAPPPDARLAAPPSPLQQALWRTARAGAGHAALRVRLQGRVPAALRLVRRLMEDAARGQGVHATGEAELLLPEATAAATTEARRAIETLLAEDAPAFVTQWTMPADASALLALAGSVATVAPALPPASPTAAGIEALADAVPLAAVARRSPVLTLGAPGQLLAGPLRLGIRQDALVAALGMAGTDRDLLRHARDRIARRLLAALAEDAARRDLLGGDASQRLVLELPPDALPLRDAPADEDPPVIEPGAARSFAALPFALAADPLLLARRRAALAVHGWGLALRGVTAGALALTAPEALEADLVLLRWSPDLAGRAAAAALRRVDPARLVLLGCAEEEALRWGLSLGIRHYGGPHPELILAAARMAACADRAGCTRRQCLLRAAAAGEDDRAGCTNRGLLAAVLPEDG